MISCTHSLKPGNVAVQRGDHSQNISTNSCYKRYRYTYVWCTYFACCPSRRQKIFGPFPAVWCCGRRNDAPPPPGVRETGVIMSQFPSLETPWNGNIDFHNMLYLLPRSSQFPSLEKPWNRNIDVHNMLYLLPRSSQFPSLTKPTNRNIDVHNMLYLLPWPVCSLLIFCISVSFYFIFFKPLQTKTAKCLEPR